VLPVTKSVQYLHTEKSECLNCLRRTQLSGHIHNQIVNQHEQDIRITTAGNKIILKNDK